MLAPHIKKNVDKLWNLFWTAGITNPLVAVEQITYLLFLKRLEGIDNERVKKGRPTIYKGQKVEDGKEIEVDHDNCRWRFIEQDKTPQHLINVVFPWLRDLEKHFAASQAPANGIEAIGGRMSDAYFQLDPNKGAILQQAIDLINKLFARVDAQGAATDIMGDTFEYLLSEIATAGKNGQFRTPRHIIRCMVEMLDPQPGEKIIDPAAGTGGFLFSSLSHILARRTTLESLRIEWDGTPHRVHGDQFTPEEFSAVHKGDYYVGLDNDRTMVRIGWMNMILHGIEHPQIHQRDSLGKRREDDPLKALLGSECYDVVLANPPFTGTVDSGDLDGVIFPKTGTKGKKATQVVTNKSELLFVWRMLDLLRVGGRCAVIVPEGVLFGNTDGHVRLRRELLTEHKVEAVISLPAGVFQPYTGVKTSVLVFQKETRKDDRDQWKPVDAPRTQQVWFYEVEQETFTLDAKRNERRGQDNDLWDLLAKYPRRHEREQAEHDYFQPVYNTERWRMVDAHTLKVFSDEAEVLRWKDQVAAINELFANLPASPEQALAQIEAVQQPRLEALAQAVFAKSIAEELTKAKDPKDDEQRVALTDKVLKKAAADFRSLCEKHKVLFDQEEKVAYPLYQKAYRAAAERADQTLRPRLLAGETIAPVNVDEDQARHELAAIAKEYARLDGYDVMLRELQSVQHEGVLKTPKHWIAPVRVYAEDPEWQSADGTIKGSHDANGNPRSQYLAANPLYDKEGKFNEGLLDPDAIEARDWNLSASQYKPFSFEAVISDKSVADMIRELKQKEGQIMQGLDRLLAMVEGE
jgi:type I restriction enzyme M protein